MARHTALVLSLSLALSAWSPGAALSDETGDGEKRAVKVIVIDPGHGGEDSGATGATGVKEKDVTLGVAKALKKALTEKLDIKVLLTRDDDRYVDLEERADIANEAGADLFISIHANAAYRRGANGVETYFLSFEASDDDARKTAAFENKVVRLDGKAEDAPEDDLKSILWDLVQTKAHHQSSELAEFIHVSLQKTMGGEDRGVKQAPFRVLVGATMPAVLVEVGFISNPREERNLSGKKGRNRIASAISKGVAEFEEALRGSAGYVKLGEAR
ncbi:MAG: N-acetylmuramoyl-L-alanine amidase [Thermodesulfobacteriota bacterium]